ncbi:MAG: hypothetical protein QN172_03725 [Armatimonadota bacterium]|nr:hypothetical protein [Armatimonadota bacterium]MDR7439967.1 hypothetical protein [Armatimonadota bacterium]MDR7562367.1 hypothetical protein [Armatimonadota bacterium]MDR7567238.1 hypothetical protein [Armatimonadota bacterium]MDR7601550.1 hypothetical protein [Armatimonadota bacterium]
MRWIAAVVLVGLVTAGYASYHEQQPAGGGEPAWRVQARTAATHAGFAAGGESMSYVEQHLGHALNCIEGPRGRNFNRAWGHVCEGQGQGILPDLRNDRVGRSWMLVAEAAGELAVKGIQSRDLAQRKNAARGVSELLRLIAEAR